MQVTVQRLSLRNFKGVKDLNINAGGASINVYGRNASGKTTIADSLYWLLLNKDSTGRAAFEIKPLDAAGNEIHNLETEVEAVLQIDMTTLTFRKLQKENWTKIRGQNEATYKGNVTEYWINDVPTTQREYNDRVTNICKGIPELLMNPAAFNALDWKKCRTLLMEGVSANAAWSRLLATDEFCDLAEEMRIKATDVDGVKKSTLATRKRLNDRLTVIPAKIDENRRITPTLDDHAIHQARLEQKAAMDELCAIDAQLVDTHSAGTAVRQRQQERQRIIGQLEIIQARIRREAEAPQREATEKVSLLQKKLKNQTAELTDKQALFPPYERQVDEAQAHVQDLRSEWVRIKAESLPAPEVESSCPACGQSLPSDQVEQAQAQAQALAEKKRGDRLGDIQRQGSAASAELHTAQAKLQRLAQEVADLEAEVKGLSSQLEALEAASDCPIEYPDCMANPEYRTLHEKLEALDDADASTDSADALNALQARKRSAQDILEHCTKVLAGKEALERCTLRIAELEQEQRDLGDELTKLEGLLAQADAFTAAYCRLLEENINGQFPSVRWKLFDTQINGGVVDVCQCMVGGVPYSDANSAARTNAGLEIIDVLGKRLSVRLPVLVDNCESVNELYPLDAQMFRLYVSEDAELRIEPDAEQHAAMAG